MAATHAPAVRIALCTCCDFPGVVHLQNVEALRSYLSDPHETTVDIDVADIPGEPWGMVFVTAGEAEAWLDEYDERERAERFYDTASRGPRR